MKKVLMIFVCVFMTTFTAFAKEDDLSYEYRNYIYTKIINELNLKRSDLVKNDKAIERINLYVDNSISMNTSFDEFKSLVNDEVESYKNSYPPEKSLFFILFGACLIFSLGYYFFVRNSNKDV